MHFGISEGKEGLKHGSRPWLRMDIFWNCPIKMKGNSKCSSGNSLTCWGPEQGYWRCFPESATQAARSLVRILF